MLLVIAALTAVSAQAADITPLTADEFSEFSMSYSERPRPDLIERAMLFLDRSGWARSSNHLLPSMMTFSCIAHRPEQRNHQWTAVINSLHEPAKSLLARAVSSSPDDLLANTPLSAQKNDMNWACYFATGDTKYIRNLLEVAAQYGERKDKDLYLVAATAMWSLASNTRFPEVRHFLRSNGGPVAKAVLGTTQQAVEAEIRSTLAAWPSSNNATVSQSGPQSQIEGTNESRSAQEQIGYVIVDRSEPAFLQFHPLRATVTAQELQNLRAKAVIYKSEVVTWEEFIKRAHDYARTAIIKNDYPSDDVAGIAVCAMKRLPGPWSITWNGGLAFSEQDYRWAKAQYDSFASAAGKSYAKPAREPIDPKSWQGQLGC